MQSSYILTLQLEDVCQAGPFVGKGALSVRKIVLVKPSVSLQK